jgi:hypothetical protein
MTTWFVFGFRRREAKNGAGEECGICTVGYYCTNDLLIMFHAGFIFVSGHMLEFKELGRPY